MKCYCRLLLAGVCSFPFGKNLFSAEDEDSTREEVVTLDVFTDSGDMLGRSYNEIPSSTTVFGEELIDEAVGTTRDQIFQRAANTTSLPGGFGSFTIRGVSDFTINPSFNTGSNSLATLFVNQVPLSSNSVAYASPSLWDIESVEIFRGPQSSSQGPNALAGSVFYHYVEPSFDYSGKLKVEYGEHGLVNTAIAQNLPIVNDSLAARFSFEKNYYEGTIQNITRDEDNYGRKDSLNYRTQLLWTPGDSGKTKFVLGYNYIRDLGDNFAWHGADTPFYDRTSTSDGDNYYDADSHLITLQGTTYLNERWCLTSISGVRVLNEESLFDGDYTSNPFTAVYNYYDEKAFTQEFRANYSRERLNVVFGAYGQYNDYQNGYDGSFYGYDIANLLGEKGKIFALFSKVEYYLLEQVKLEAGLRYNYEERDVENETSFSGVLGAYDDTVSFKDWIPSASITYELSNTQNVGFLISRGYRSGGVIIAPFMQVASSYDPEYAWNYEAFYHGSFLENHLHINASVFYMDWKDLQVTTNIEGGFAGYDETIDNVGTAELQGFEFEMSYKLDNHWSLSAALGYAHTEFGDYRLDSSSTGDRSGESFPFSPEWNASIGVNYKTEKGIFASLTCSWVDACYSDIANLETSHIRDKTLVSGKLGYDFTNWSVYVFGTNLLDLDYPEVLYDTAAYGLPNPYYGQAGEPRTVGIGVETSW
jgi:outer membrane receptor protein involved in Fe transport